ncbi:MAG: hypothetical protein ACJ74O_01715 [Frankiaceae bacterium]
MELSGLVRVLAKERAQLETLVLRLQVLARLIEAGDDRLLPIASDDVERATAAVRSTELQRALLVAQLAADLGVPPDSLTLRGMVTVAPSPWRPVLADHRWALLRLVADVEAAAAACRVAEPVRG